jgi:hypothetical protein
MFAALKNAVALQAPTWVNDENSPLTSSPATQLACCRIASWVGEAAGESPGFAGGSVAVPPAVVAEALAVGVALAVTGALPVGAALAVGAAPLDDGAAAPDAADVADGDDDGCE